jgi:hypothetical protein
VTTYPGSTRRATRRTLLVAVLGAGSILVAAVPGLAASGVGASGTSAQQRLARTHARALHQARRASGVVVTAGEEEDAGEIADRAGEWANERNAPAQSAPAAALLAAEAHAAALPTSSAGVTEVTKQPYQAEPKGYTDPVESNAGAGFGIVSGRATALATDGTSTYYAGTADGGVWKSTDRGGHWAPLTDHLGSLSIGALIVDPADHSLWVGTGEANTSSDSYRGIGVWRSTDGGASFRRVGGSELNDSQIFRLVKDGAGHVYAATSKGLWRHSGAPTAAWTRVLKPDPNPTGSPYLTSFITDAAVQPGSHGQTVLAVLGWRNGSSYNGFYLSTTGGGAGSFRAITPKGAIDATDIGRTTLAYAADGSRLYALIQSPAKLLSGAATVLQGAFVSASGNPAGPWTKIADSSKLGKSGSALAKLDGYHVGVQAWYNQALAVDPMNPKHVYLSLEEVFESTDGGATFATASPYWNYGLACGASCPKTTHPDQHALLPTGDGQVIIANDGGVYRRPMSAKGYGDWTNTNATLRTLQYYDAKAGRLGGRTGYWGGLQDNGTSFQKSPTAQNIEPAGGDGGAVVVDPSSANRSVGEYTNLAMYSTQDGGHTFTTISPECGYNPAKNCDPGARFIAPFVADVHDSNHWVAGGNVIWDSRQGWNTTCDAKGCTWRPVHSLGNDASGLPNLATALAVSGATTYAAWVDYSGNPSPFFATGIDTNFGGSWHRIASPVLPNRYVAGLTVDPANPAHVYAVYNGYSRRWIPGGGLGSLFESKDGGSTWANVTGNLPDAPGDGLAISGSKLVLGTDIGIFIANRSTPQRWARLPGLPNVVVDNVSPTPDGKSVVAATHGRGIWLVTPVR